MKHAVGMRLVCGSHVEVEHGRLKLLWVDQLLGMSQKTADVE